MKFRQMKKKIAEKKVLQKKRFVEDVKKKVLSKTQKFRQKHKKKEVLSKNFGIKT